MPKLKAMPKKLTEVFESLDASGLSLLLFKVVGFAAAPIL